jgi:hypothetical protein
MSGSRDEVGEHSAFRVQQADVVLEAFEDETIAVNLGTGRYYSLDLIGAETLELLTSGRELGAVTAHLAARYATEPALVDTMLREFACELLEQGLICLAATAEATAFPERPTPVVGAFAAPSLSIFSDMEDLLLLDPIHEVGEAGWPVRRDATEAEQAGPRDPR